MSAVAEARRRLGDVLLSRVAGPEAHTARRRIHGEPGPRWFGPEDPIQRVHGDASMYVGGLRALLLQSLHPLAMAAVAQHSDYRSDPWGRLARTSTFIAETTYARTEDAERAIAVVRAVHRYVSGTTTDGRPYRADDPHLLTWVHVAEIDSFLTAHQIFGRRPLDEADIDAYVAQTAGVARRLGGERVPTTHAELRETLERYRPELEQTPEALEAAEFLLHRPPITGAARFGYALIGRAAVATLPPWAREPLRLDGRRSVTGGRLAGHVATRSLRWALGGIDPVDTPTPDSPH
ncbi:DUF2236 domain-containing protein [Georgenia wutianyii]|uniref:DUF2236 domain-containing protein n=1 Tax=Georgenia wutianyii TaxID=2585135 RepID=A0ABX5VS61_9MICO|nr:oxygenase MpaB family protein [Georgenia wutianyii]QDB79510.1 DUF2236 domain-containing protein [Georgenia wutianyii]